MGRISHPGATPVMITPEPTSIDAGSEHRSRVVVLCPAAVPAGLCTLRCWEEGCWWELWESGGDSAKGGTKLRYLV
jgi:hypothetical protein